MSWPAEKCLPSPASTITLTVVVVDGARERGVERVGHRGVLRVAVLRPVQRDARDRSPTSYVTTSSSVTSVSLLSSRLQHLAGRVAGQLVDELDLARHLEVGQPLLANAITSSASRPRRPAYDVRLADLAQPLVGHADDRGLGDTVEPGERLLDLGRVDVEAAADVHVLEPVGDA